jgi:hypothetical protein
MGAGMVSPLLVDSAGPGGTGAGRGGGISSSLRLFHIQILRIGTTPR